MSLNWQLEKKQLERVNKLLLHKCNYITGRVSSIAIMIVKWSMHVNS